MNDFAIRDTPDTMPAGTPPKLAANGQRLAILRPAHAKQSEETVELWARTNRGLVVVCKPPNKPKGQPAWWSVYSFRLIDAATRRPLKRADLVDLPWKGKGPDPDKKDAAT